MELIDGALFLAFVALGAFLQTITGFAMGLIIMGGVVALDLAQIDFSAAVVSIVSLVNVVTALRHSVRDVDRQRFTYICVGMVPALIGGVILIGILSASSYSLARQILGLVILLAGAMLLFRPAPWSKASPPIVVGLAGFLGGITGGLFSTGGPPIAFLLYRQPIPVAIIRATLLAVFATSTLARTLFIAVLGQITTEIMVLSAAAIPVVLATTLLAQRALPYFSDLQVRKLVFVLLIAIGSYLLLN